MHRCCRGDLELDIRENPYIAVMTNTEHAIGWGEAAEEQTRAAIDRTTDVPQHEAVNVVVPIRSLDEGRRAQIADHLLQLDEHDRYLRFGYIATEAQIRRYVDGLDFERDEILAIANRKLVLIAVAHLAYAGEPGHPPRAEFGVSVHKAARGRGYGARLFERAAMDARNVGVELMFIHALSENTAMLRIARKAGATIERNGSESEAFLRLPQASLNSRLTEIVEDHWAQIDYQLKAQSQQLRSLFCAFKALRRAWQGSDSNTDC